MYVLSIIIHGVQMSGYLVMQWSNLVFNDICGCNALRYSTIGSTMQSNQRASVNPLHHANDYCPADILFVLLNWFVMYLVFIQTWYGAKLQRITTKYYPLYIYKYKSVVMPNVNLQNVKHAFFTIFTKFIYTFVVNGVCGFICLFVCSNFQLNFTQLPHILESWK